MPDSRAVRIRFRKHGGSHAARAPLALLLLVLAATPAPAVQQIFRPGGSLVLRRAVSMELRSRRRRQRVARELSVSGERAGAVVSRRPGADARLRPRVRRVPQVRRRDRSRDAARRPAASAAPGSSLFLDRHRPALEGARDTHAAVDPSFATRATRGVTITRSRRCRSRGCRSSPTRSTRWWSPTTCTAQTRLGHGLRHSSKQMRAGGRDDVVRGGAASLIEKLGSSSGAEGLSREHVVGETVFRTGDPTRR